MKKIMFNDTYSLTKDVLLGNKIQTRRTIKPQPELTDRAGFIWKGFMYGVGVDIKETYKNFIECIKTPYKVGEIVAIAQRYSDVGSSVFEGWEQETDWFKKGWGNKMFVRADYMPNILEFKGLKLEKLQDISDEDCIKEGIYEKDGLFCHHAEPNKKFLDYTFDTPREAYASLINKISGKGTWESNPYVYVYDFELFNANNKI